MAFTAESGEMSVVGLGVHQVAPPSSDHACQRWPPKPRHTIHIFPLANSTTAGSPRPSGFVGYPGGGPKIGLRCHDRPPSSL